MLHYSSIRSIKLSTPTSDASLKIQVKMLSAKRMKFLFLVLSLLAISNAKITKQKKDVSAKAPKTSTSSNAIIAIEIVDPNENKTSTRNSKRTIESALGYGYSNNYSPPKYEVYKYSQHDIPPYRAPVGGHYSGHLGNLGQVYNIQKSVSYDLGSQTIHPQKSYYQSSGYTHSSPGTNLNSYYQPGTTLYSTLNNQGQLSHLSANLPSQAVGGHVPVIILRIFPSQLTSGGGGLYARLPQSHPFAANINSINLQSLLSKHVQSSLQHDNHQVQQPQLYQAPQPHAPKYQQAYQQAHDYSYSTQDQQGPTQYYSYQQYQQPKVQYHYSYQIPTVHNHIQQYQGTPKLQTFENYPDDVHTRVVFKDGIQSTAVPQVASHEQANVQPQYNYQNGDEQGNSQTGYYYEKPVQELQEPGSQGYYPEVIDNLKNHPQQNSQFDVSEFLPAQYTKENYEEEAPIPPEQSEDSKQEPFNYHAHPNGPKNSERQKKNVRVKSKEKQTTRGKREE